MLKRAQRKLVNQMIFNSQNQNCLVDVEWYLDLLKDKKNRKFASDKIAEAMAYVYSNEDIEAEEIFFELLDYGYTVKWSYEFLRDQGYSERTLTLISFKVKLIAFAEENCEYLNWGVLKEIDSIREKIWKRSMYLNRGS